jgi:hypothetical protein
MSITKRLTAKEVALTACFTAVYVVLSFVPMFQIVGLFKTITASTILAPIIGILLGPYLAVTSTLLGGAVSLFTSPLFSEPSLIAGVVAALFAALLYANRRILCVPIYAVLLIAFGLYPSVGPVWLYPLQMWFQIGGFLILISPLQSVSTRNLRANNNSKFLPAFFVIFLTSTLASQIAGSLVYEMVFWPSIFPEVSTWQATWMLLSWVYPAERLIIALLGAFAGAAVYKALKPTNLLPTLNLESEREPDIR